jgi:hypothetical protein
MVKFPGSTDSIRSFLIETAAQNRVEQEDLTAITTLCELFLK